MSEEERKRKEAIRAYLEEERKRKEAIRAHLQDLAKKWPSSFVSREKVGEFSGGILHPRTMANTDSNPAMEGPERVRFGRKVAYPVQSLIAWMERRAA